MWIGAEDLPYTKQEQGVPPSQFGYSNLRIGIAYFPMPQPGGGGYVFATATEENREQAPPA
jgi:hypothetical protein